jgi:hypothetical protein
MIKIKKKVARDRREWRRFYWKGRSTANCSAGGGVGGDE